VRTSAYLARLDIRPACVAHDRCYATPDVRRARCELVFRNRLERSCRARFAGEVDACLRWARDYHTWILRRGGPAYRRAQAEARPGFAVPDEQRGPERCGTGEPIVDLTRTLRGAVDIAAGTPVRYWAYDTTTERLRVWERPDGSYCEIWDDRGRFVSVAGPSPAGQDVLAAGVRGTLLGIDRTTYRATLDESAQLRGTLPAADYGCEIHGPENTSRTCSGRGERLRETVFSNVRGERFEFSGWLYRSPGHGTWLQLGATSRGDIYG
jgi:hypothetical protein